jgi:hypothetical protein
MTYIVTVSYLYRITPVAKLYPYRPAPNVLIHPFIPWA